MKMKRITKYFEKSFNFFLKNALRLNKKEIYNILYDNILYRF